MITTRKGRCQVAKSFGSLGSLAKEFAMNIRRITLVLVTAVVVPTVCVFGQAGRREYSTARPAVSPYLNLLRENRGPVPNYHSLVRPQLQQHAINRQQQAINQQQQTSIRAQQRGLKSVQTGLLEVRRPQAGPTGRVGGFMNYGQFYSFSGSPVLGR
jgi:hypothetical protein